MNGMMCLPTSRGSWLYVMGGPYRECPKWAWGIRLTDLYPQPAEIVFPIKDFSVPQAKDVDRVLPMIMDAVMDPQNMVYVGCMGGWGRTGLMLSIIAKAWGIPEPIKYVRNVYSHKAVETKAQEQFVEDYRIPWKIRWRVFWRKNFGI